MWDFWLFILGKAQDITVKKHYPFSKGFAKQTDIMNTLSRSHETNLREQVIFKVLQRDTSKHSMNASLAGLGLKT